jgi:thiaminase/transcriptional activator TenA
VQKKFVEYIWDKMIEVVEQTVKQVYFQELVAGTLPMDKFKFYAKQNYKYLVEYTKTLAIALAKSPDYDTEQVWKNGLIEVNDVEIPFFREYCRKELGLSIDELEGTIMSNVKRSYTSHELARAWEGSSAELLAAILPCALCYWQNALRLSEMCKLPKEHLYRRWIDLYFEPAYVKLCEDLIVTMNNLCEGKTEKELRRIEEIFLVSCQYELLSWDAYYNKVTWPMPQVFRDIERR